MNLNTMHIDDVIDLFRTLSTGLNDYKNKFFPVGSEVRVECSQFKGFGFVSRQDGCPPDRLPVRLENGNTWQYPIEACQAPGFDSGLPRWMQSELNSRNRKET